MAGALACAEGLASARKILEPPAAPLPFPRLLPIARKLLETFSHPYFCRSQEVYFDQRAGRAAQGSQTTPNSDVPFIKYKKVSRMRRNYPQNALFPTPHIGGKMPELTGTHRNSPGTTPGTHPGTHPGAHPGTSLLYDFVVGACVAGASLIGFFDRSLQTQNFRRLPLWGFSTGSLPWNKRPEKPSPV